MTDTVTKRIGSGDRLAVAEVFDQHGEALLHCAIATTLDIEYGMHACEKLFVNLMDLVRMERPSDQSMKKLLFFALHAEINHTAKNRRLSQKPVDTILVAGTATLPETYVEKTEEMLRRLKEQDREVVVFKALGGLSLGDIAEITTERFDLIDRRHQEAVKRALDVLKPKDGEPEDIDIWLKRVKVRVSGNSFRNRAVAAFVTKRISQKKSRAPIWIAIGLFLLAGLAAGLKFLSDAQLQSLRDFFNAP
jgi:DNA-directed RNA polymerase specialized sigma24 family protein